MDRIVVTSILIVAGITVAGIVAYSIISNVQKDSQSTSDLQSSLRNQVQSKISIVTVSANIEGTQLSIWSKNTGNIDIGPISDIDLFVERIDGTWGERIPFQEPSGMTWTTDLSTGDDLWLAGQTIRFEVSIPDDPNFPTPVSEKTGMFKVSLYTPNSARATHVFEHNPFFRLTVIPLPSAGGDVMGSGVYQMGQQVTVNYSPHLGYRFDGWSGACSGLGPCTIIMDGPKTTTASFVVR
tara:strand:+ start:18978 stop:19694 length:717 start_codon:yes stop_codon:yes gene_type:complete